jgi:hypothetical protein
LEAPFELLAAIDETGIADIEIRFEPPTGLNGSPDGFKREEKVDLKVKNAAYWRASPVEQLRTPECGPFLVHIRAWVRISKWLAPASKIINSYLDQFDAMTNYTR